MALIKTKPTTTRSNQSEFSVGWFCIKVEKFYCRNCDHESEFVHNTNKGIVVWPEKDHEEILSHAAKIMAMRPETNPRIVEYEPEMGEAISYNEV